MSRSLRLKATGERLIWYVSLTVDELGMREYRYLQVDGDDDLDDGWFAVLLPGGHFEVYRCKANDFSDIDGYLDPILVGPYNDIPAAQHFCESALIEAGVAEYIDEEEEPFPSD